MINTRAPDGANKFGHTGAKLKGKNALICTANKNIWHVFNKFCEVKASNQKTQ